jgi:hypothetical protein
MSQNRLESALSLAGGANGDGDRLGLRRSEGALQGRPDPAERAEDVGEGRVDAFAEVHGSVKALCQHFSTSEFKISMRRLLNYGPGSQA